MRYILILLSVVAAACGGDNGEATAGMPQPYEYHTAPHVIFYDDGESLILERGLFFAPIDHADPESLLLRLPFYRVPAKGPASAPPLFLLAGGPGNSYFDDLQRTEFRAWIEFYREIGDVVILEQRGANEALPKPACDYPVDLPADEPADLRTIGDRLRDRVLRCAETWREAGLDLRRFNIEQMALDFDRLRSALGYESFNLKGGSFGSQLALTILRNHSRSVHRAVLYGVEGLDDTYDLPALANRQFEKVAVEVARDPALAPLVPDFLELTRRVLERLEKKPVVVAVADPETGDPVEVAVGATDARLILWSQSLLQGYREGIAKVPALLLAADNGEFAPLANAKLAWLARSGEVNTMIYMVDCGTGLSERRRRLLAETESAWLLDPRIVDYHLYAVCPALDPEDAGEDFRRGAASDTPVLFISGSLDAFTPPEYAESAVRNFPAGHWLLAERGDHSGWAILDEFPALKSAVREFLRGSPLPADFPERIDMPPLEFVTPETFARPDR